MKSYTLALTLLMLLTSAGLQAQFTGGSGRGDAMRTVNNSKLEGIIFTSDGDWDQASNWNTNTVPDLSAYVVIDAEADISTEVDIHGISVASGKILTIKPEGELSVSGRLENEGTLTIQSDATGTGSLIHNTPDVQATVEHHLVATDGWDKSAPFWHWISPPASGQDIDAFLDALTESEEYDLYRWDEATDTWLNYKAGDGVPSNAFAHEAFMPGTGYLFAANELATFSYTGNLHAEDMIWTDLTNKGEGVDEGEISYEAGWNLLGNPFSSGIVYHNDYWSSDAGNVELTPKYWDESDDSYKAYQQDAVIPPMTAFFNRVTVENTPYGSLTISREARRHYNAETKSAPAGGNYITLTASPLNGSTRQFSYIRLAKNTQQGFDYRYDASFGPGNAPLFYSLKDEHRLMVQAVAAISEDLVIPFFFRENQEGPDFRIALKERIPGHDLYLLDLKTDSLHLLSQHTPYQFTASQGDNPMRFELHFSKNDEPTGIDEPQEDDPQIRVWAYNNRLYVDNPGENTELHLYDISGRRLQVIRAPAGQHSFELNLRAGVYVVKSSLNRNHKAQKIIIQ